MVKKLSGSSQPGKRTGVSATALSSKTLAQLAALAAIPDAAIDYSDIPETLNWQKSVIGKFYRPVKKPISLRVDLDVLVWFQALGTGYQTKMNEALRKYMSEYRQAGIYELMRGGNKAGKLKTPRVAEKSGTAYKVKRKAISKSVRG